MRPRLAGAWSWLATTCTHSKSSGERTSGSWVRSHPGVDQSYWLVYFTDFGASSLDIFVYYFSKSIVWAEYLEVRQDVNLKIMRKLAEMGLEFAFPSQTVYLKRESA